MYRIVETDKELTILSFGSVFVVVFIIANVYLELAIPCRDYTKMWKDTKYYDILLTKCDIKTVVNDEPYKPKHMQLRNIYMVDKSDMVIAVYDGYSSGGTKNCIDYAKNKYKNIVFIDPYK